MNRLDILSNEHRRKVFLPNSDIVSTVLFGGKHCSLFYYIAYGGIFIWVCFDLARSSLFVVTLSSVDEGSTPTETIAVLFTGFTRRDGFDKYCNSLPSKFFLFLTFTVIHGGSTAIFSFLIFLSLYIR